MARSKKVQCRIPEVVRNDFDQALEITGMGETQFVEAAIKAFIEYVREHGGIWLPLAIVPKRDAVPEDGAHPVLCPTPEKYPALAVPTKAVVVRGKSSGPSTPSLNEEPPPYGKKPIAKKPRPQR
jgi:hypothetical protein